MIGGGADFVQELAPAKVNLTLHVTGRRADGYHLLDSLVAFAGVGDGVAVGLSAAPALRITGPMAADVPGGEENLAMRAARLFDVAATVRLDKHLPAASGLGGGSSDAAAVLRALARLTGRPMPDALRVLALGADVPVCLAARSRRMRGIGERLDEVPALPALPAVLLNPGISVATPEVFARLENRDGAAMVDVPEFAGARDCIGWLATQRNDLEAPARALAPVIGDALRRLRDAGALLARMSGSGATCFGLFAGRESAARAAAAINAHAPGWWVRATVLGSSDA